MTSQKPRPLSVAERNFSRPMYLPRRTPSMSKPPTLIFVMLGSASKPWTVLGSISVKTELQRNPNGFDLRIRLEGVLAHLAAEAALLVTAERSSAVEAIVGIDPHDSGLDRPRQAMRAPHVASPDSGNESVNRSIRDSHGFLIIGEFDGGEHRPENFFLGNFHFGPDSAEDGWLREEAFGLLAFGVALAAALQARALLDAGVHISEDPVELRLRNLRAHFRFRIERVPDNHLL